MITVLVLSRRRRKVRQTIEELERRQFDDDARSRSRGLSLAAQTDPVGRLVPRQHIADASDAAVFTTPDGKPLQRKWQTGIVSQQVLKALTIARHVAVDERDPHAGVDQKPTVLSSDHIDVLIGVEEPLHTELTHDTTAHLLGERGQIGLVDRNDFGSLTEMGRRLARSRHACSSWPILQKSCHFAKVRHLTPRPGETHP